eukprot:GFYU01000295.1.p2 GENE.GFYU01000295.1~~GFYU01000295.1.p2  ORF type:complete len:542 (+),score=212.82 GFYU01000295.1:157-1782(+)
MTGTTLTTVERQLLDNIRDMDAANGYDYVLVCTSNESQENFWQNRLMKSRGLIAKKEAQVVCVHEDWDGGAGNGLGTLYAYVKAAAKAKETLGVDLLDELRSGKSAALYHTAGKGTRLAPLPGAENNNKPGVKLPSILCIDGENVEMTILEAVVKQTGAYAQSRTGRLSVFWGDQVFVPSLPSTYKPSHHADILASLDSMPDQATWAAKGMDKYGLIAVNSEGNATQVEKISYETAAKLFPNKEDVEGGIGVSLGSFSVSHELLSAMLTEFADELRAKKGKMDADPHFWMPLTLPVEQYCTIMQTKGTSVVEATAHFERMQLFLQAFEKANSAGCMFGAVNVGKDCYWWDYGQLKLFQKNNLLMTESSNEAAAMRTFFGVAERVFSSKVTDASVDDASIVLGSQIGKGKIVNSVLVNVIADEINVENAVLINVTAHSIAGVGTVIYNAVDEDSIELPAKGVRADVFIPKKSQVKMQSCMDTDGGKAWHEKVYENEFSFDELHRENSNVDVVEAEEEAKVVKKRISRSLSVYDSPQHTGLSG